MTHFAHFDDELNAILKDAKESLRPNTPPMIVEAVCTQIKAMRDARHLVSLDGAMVRDGKNNPIAHPALELERAAQKQLADLIKPWILRKPGS